MWAYSSVYVDSFIKIYNGNIEINAPWFGDNKDLGDVIAQSVLNKKAKLGSIEEEEDNDLDAESTVIAREAKKCV